ncbi:copper chaperone [Polynucleobacter necessarius]|uniref:copper chaperone n=1 Tax=Polynucleobacter necessarius TaxID=576610 RepID=UPI0018D53AE3|nr:copper chaperone [Polynucleobacter necessarius]
MTCGGCINAVTRAKFKRKILKAIVTADLATQTVNLQTILSAEQAGQLITDAGFSVAA